MRFFIKVLTIILLFNFVSLGADFDKYFPHLINSEGVKFTIIKYDRGGATKFGITIGTYKYWCKKETFIGIGCDKNGDFKVDAKDLNRVTMGEIKPIYRVMFWNRVYADSIHNQGVAEMFVDFLVNSGMGYKNGNIKAIQKIVGVSQDGIIGRNTLQAINKMYPPSLFDKIFKYRQSFYKRLVRKDYQQKKFLTGWNNRINLIYKYCKNEKYI